MYYGDGRGGWKGVETVGWGWNIFNGLSGRLPLNQSPLNQPLLNRTQPQSLHAAVDRQRSPRRRPRQRARQVSDGAGHLSRVDHPAVRLAGVEGGALGGRVSGGIEQPANPGSVHGAGVHAVHTDALTDVVRRHGERQRQDRALRRRVQGTLRKPGRRCDGTGVHDRGRRGLAQVWQGCPADAGDAHNVDVEDTQPFVVVVR